ncbi:penicillin-binding protein activator [Carnimonas bestiolae]|uniref:penicillin-binding protein activator n=1 Tax=Carnimonas bestiolae TaxID=3402172 RepID=UPI003EDB7B1A
MRDTLHRLSGLTLASLILSGCASSPFGGDQPSSSSLLQNAEQQQGSEAAQSRLQAAEMLLKQGDQQQAAKVINQIDGRDLDDDGRARFAVIKAESAYNSGDYDTAANIANAALGQLHLSTEQRYRLETVQGQTLGRQGDHLKAAAALISAQRDSQNDPALNDAIWRELAALNESQLNQLSNPDALSDGWITLSQLRLQNSGDLAEFKQQIGHWRSAYPEHPASQRPPHELTAVQNLNAEEVTRIAVLLPQSGPYATVAGAIRQGMEAQNQALAASGGNAPTLDFIDATSGSIDDLYNQAKAQGAQVVVGPLDKDQVTQLEGRSQLPLPTLALNYGNAASNQASNLYEYGLSAEDEARQVADHAAQQGHHTASILVPDNGWGGRVLDAFSQQWQANGQQVGNVQRYQPNGSATSTVRSAIQGGADMLFMLGLPPYARQVPPALRYYNSDVPVYATSHAYSGTPSPSDDNDLNGVNFLDIPWEIPGVVGGNLPFPEAYRALHDDANLPAPALKLAAMGVDAYELAKRLPVYQSIPSSQLQGATGMLKVSDNRRFSRQLPWAVFRGGVPSTP